MVDAYQPIQNVLKKNMRQYTVFHVLQFEL